MSRVISALITSSAMIIVALIHTGQLSVSFLNNLESNNIITEDHQPPESFILPCTRICTQEVAENEDIDTSQDERDSLEKDQSSAKSSGPQDGKARFLR